MAKSMGMGKIRPPQLRNRFTDFYEIRILELTSEDNQKCKISFRSDDVGGLGEYPVCHCWVSVFVFLSFLVASSRAQVAPVDRF